MAANDNGNPISYVAETGRRTEPDGTEKRVHLGYSVEGFHSAIETTKNDQATEPYQWGKAYPAISAATEAAWNEVFKNDPKEQHVAELPEHVRAKADEEMAKTGAQKMPVQDMNAAPAVDNYDDQGKALDAMREQKRQEALQEKTPDPTMQPDKG